MPEESIETAEMKEQLEEAVEKAEEKREAWMTKLSLLPAVIAVIAAIAALQAGSFANEALLLKNEAVLAKTQAADKYNEYEFRKVKTHVYRRSSRRSRRIGRTRASPSRRRIDRETELSKEPLAEARKLDEESEAKNVESQEALARHETFRARSRCSRSRSRCRRSPRSAEEGDVVLLDGARAGRALLLRARALPHGEAPKGERGAPAVSAAPKE